MSHTDEEEEEFIEEGQEEEESTEGKEEGKKSVYLHAFIRSFIHSTSGDADYVQRTLGRVPVCDVVPNMCSKPFKVKDLLPLPLEKKTIQTIHDKTLPFYI